MTKLYLAGPMTGIPEFNHPAFRENARLLRSVGYEVFSPAEHDLDLGIDVAGKTGNETLTDFSAVSIRDVLGDDLDWICREADGLAVLPNWKGSKGTRAEIATALAIRIPVMGAAQWYDSQRYGYGEDIDYWTGFYEAALTGTLPVGLRV